MDRTKAYAVLRVYSRHDGILTTKNSPTISTSEKAVNCQNCIETAKKIEDFLAEYKGSISFTRSNLPFRLATLRDDRMGPLALNSPAADNV
ncbi:hypothetical protein ABIG06_007279 [Bradyrhizobium sp. USDA 326]|uniref:hypothetical protein n=1 Tax=unclassified Bradyrhizobium TaxID=2631580 RepID=UPI003511043C